MNFKLIVAMVKSNETDGVVEAAKAAGWRAELFIDAATTRHSLATMGLL